VAILHAGPWAIDYAEAGAGPPVILVHSSVSGNRQWRRLLDDLADRYRLLAINLFGYGKTTPWPGGRPQSLEDQVELVAALAGEVPGPLHLVGHSFGGAVAMKAAVGFGPRVSRLVLLEPNPFAQLAAQGRTAAFAEIQSLCAHVKGRARAGDWPRAGADFADYWLGEWDAVMNDATPLAAWREITAETLVLRAARTKRPIVEIAELLAAACPHWRFAEVPEGGHMAPVLRPDLVNPVIAAFLDGRLE
jgi:pimeloyl-ACP methyl ester carboxylesterase